MPEGQSSDQGAAVRTAEVIAAACLATDLGMGFPFEHGLHATLVSCRLAELLEVDSATAAQTYYASLLMYAGCTVDSDVAQRIFGGSMGEHFTHRQFGSQWESLGGIAAALPDPEAGPVRSAWQVAVGLPRAARFRDGHFAALCEVAEMLAERLGVPAQVSGLFPLLTERWDGKSVLRRAAGDEIPLPLRIVHVARDAAWQEVVGGADHAATVIRERAGNAFDPDVAEAFAANAGELLGPSSHSGSVWDAVLDGEPNPRLELDDAGLYRALAALGDFADLVSPSLAGHSVGVAALAGAAAAEAAFTPDEVRTVERAGLVHDVGRVAVRPRVWQKPGALSSDEWEQVRLHAYHTERVLHRTTVLAPAVEVAALHHERSDGSGYHRGVAAATLDPAARLLAAADAYRAMAEPRSHRAALDGGVAAEILAGEARDGRHDPDMVAAVLRAAGADVPVMPRPAGLTEREVEVLGLLARGLQTKQVARRLDISVKTADRHIQNTYRKIGVSTRAAATLFATEHGLVPWGDLPIG